MKAAFIITGGIGDFLLSSPAIISWKNRVPLDNFKIYVNSHKELLNFINECTPFHAFPCPTRLNVLKEPENPLNLGIDFLDELFQENDKVYALCPDSLGQMPFAFPWYDYDSNYEDFSLLKCPISFYNNFTHEALNQNTKNILIHATSVTFDKNLPMPALQKLIDLFAQTNYNVIITRTSQWQGTPIPFMVQGKFHDIVDQPISRLVNFVAHSDYVISIDSAISHLAYHLNKPRLTLNYNQHPLHLVRYHTLISQELTTNTSPEQIFNRVMLNLRDPITQKIPASLNIPYQTSTKQLLYKKYYD